MCAWIAGIYLVGFVLSLGLMSGTDGSENY